jgi:hypothetical protein
MTTFDEFSNKPLPRVYPATAEEPEDTSEQDMADMELEAEVADIFNTRFWGALDIVMVAFDRYVDSGINCTTVTTALDDLRRALEGIEVAIKNTQGV